MMKIFKYSVTRPTVGREIPPKWGILIFDVFDCHCIILSKISNFNVGIFKNFGPIRGFCSTVRNSEIYYLKLFNFDKNPGDKINVSFLIKLTLDKIGRRHSELTGYFKSSSRISISIS